MRIASSTPSRSRYGLSSLPGLAGLACRVTTCGLSIQISCGSSIVITRYVIGRKLHSIESIVVLPVFVPPTMNPRRPLRTIPASMSSVASSSIPHSSSFSGLTGSGSKRRMFTEGYPDPWTMTG